MGVVWTHADCFSEYACARAGWCQGFVRAAGGSSSHGGGEAAAGCGGGEQWAAARCRQQRGVPCAVEGVSVVAVPSGLRWRCVGAASIFDWDKHVINKDIQDAIPALTRQGAADVIVIVPTLLRCKRRAESKAPHPRPDLRRAALPADDHASKRSACPHGDGRIN
jgi:hypothetical protein